MTTLYLDLETYSEMPITNGTYAYAENAEVMLVGYAVDDGPVTVLDLTAGHGIHDGVLGRALRNPEIKVVIHNSMFDRNVMRYALSITLPTERIIDTMVTALAHSLPGGLGPLCEILGVPVDQAKDKRGRDLIHLFCKPRPKTSVIRRATRDTHPQEWKEFIEYAALDIEAMRAVYKRLPWWNNTDTELGLWRLDQAINDRGIQVDTDLAHRAIEAIAKEKGRLAANTSEITLGVVDTTTRRDLLLRYILEAYGVDLPNMQAATIERCINDPELPIEVRELLAIRLQASTASVAKYKSLTKAVNRDGRLRGTLQFCGASRTGRWSGRTFQPQNLPRPSLKAKVIEQGIEAIKAGCVDLLTDNVMELTSNAVRGCIVAPAGKKLVVSDLSNIEGRVAAWLADEDWKLDAFAAYDAGTGHDLYALAYAKAFNITPEEVMENKKSGDGMMRQVGKVMELMLQYEGGVGAFVTGAATYRVDLDKLADVAWPNIPSELRVEAAKSWEWAVKKKATFGLPQKTYIVCDALKRMWRIAHPQISSYWLELKDTVIQAIANPETTYAARRLKIVRNKAWLRIILPSGRSLCYPGVRVENGAVSYMGMNQYTKKWSRIKTYGGKIFENICQAVARDVMAANMPGIDKAGYLPCLSIHDELITEAPDTPEYTAKGLSMLISHPPDWAGNRLPLAAGGFEAYRYRKD